MYISNFKKITDYIWELPKEYRDDMRVPARVYTTKNIFDKISSDRSLEQLVNVATLPGIVSYALAMPDMHEGYGFPIGGVAAFDTQEGIISPGGIGYDINCGVRLLKSEKTVQEVKPLAKDLGRTIFHEVPSGVGRSGNLTLARKEFDEILKRGARRMIEMGYGEEEDIKNTESEGVLKDADPSLVSGHAKDRGHDQLGTMGAGNHFIEVGVVDEIYDEKEAKRLGLFKDQVTVLIHTGSRGLGHQIATDYIRIMMNAMPKYGIKIPDRELACAPFASPEGQNYWKAMSAGANFAWANRQLITHEVRKAWDRVFNYAGIQTGKLDVVYDVAHNIAKLEKHTVDGKEKELVVHRKGATRSFPGEPVLIPGSMGTYSYVLVGSEGSMRSTFGSSCHGAGRVISRTKARKKITADELRKELEEKGIVVNAGSKKGLAEEAPLAYKDVESVVEIVHQAGLAKKVVRLRPLVVIKG